MPRAVIDLVTGSMSGRVLDADGRPLAGATVELSTHWLNDEEKSLIRNATTTTDAGGRYLISGVREHPGHAILVKEDHHAVEMLYSIVVKENAETRNPDIRLQRGKTIRGRVLDESGKPVEGALIQPKTYQVCAVFDKEVWAAAGELREDMTDVEGRYELTHLRGPRYGVQASKEGFISEHAIVGDGESEAPDIILGTLKTFTVKVVDRAGRPIDSAAIFLDGRGSVGSTPLLRTDSAGRLELKGLHAVPDRMEVSAPGYLTRAFTEPASGTEIVLEPEAR